MNIWKRSEGDNWYLRNKERLGKGFDGPLFLMEMYSLKPSSVLEIGASNGYRLAKIHDTLGAGVVGSDPSSRAVAEGQAQFPFIEFHNCTCDELKLKSDFDLIIVNFVMHWIERERLFDSISIIDRLLLDDGFLIIGDFGTDHCLKRRYHHVEDSDIYTWKMPYWDIFTKSGKYMEIAKIRFDHDGNKLSSNITMENMATTVLLKKQDSHIEA